MIKSIIQHVLKFRLLFIIAILVLTSISAIYFFKNYTRSDNSIPVWFAADNHKFEIYQNYLNNFGNDRFILLAFEVPDVFSSSTLKFIKEMTETLEQIHDIDRVVSITSVETIENEGETILIHPFVETVPENPVALDNLRKKALADPDYIGNLISKDAKITTLISRISTKHTAEESSQLKKEILEVIKEKNKADYPYHLSGSPIFDESFNRLSLRDQKVFVILAILIISILLVLFFRNLFMAMTPLIAQVVVLIWTLTLFFLSGNVMNVVGSMIYPILITVCVASAVHIMLEYYHYISNGIPKETALIQAVNRLWRPCLYVTLTTIAGFISFKTSSIPPVSFLGTMIAIGIFLAFLMTIFFIPIILSFFKEPERQVALSVHEGIFKKFLEFAANLTWKRSTTMGFIFFFLCMMAIVGIWRLKIETNFVEYFFKGEKVRQDMEFFQEKLSGAEAYEVIISSKNPDLEIVKDPNILREVDKFKKWITKDSITFQAETPADTIKKLNQALFDGHPEDYRIPNTKEEIAQLLFTASSGGEMEIDRLKTPDNKTIHIALRCRHLSSEKTKDYLDKVYTELKTRFEPLGLNVELTGYGPLWVDLHDQILKSQISSFLLAFLIVSIIMMIFFKSLKVGIISMIPNVIPVLYAMGLMGFLGIHLNVATVMIAGVSIGIIVDDTIHYINRFKECLHQEKDYRQALLLTNQSIGKAIIFSSIILIGGFGVLCFASFTPTFYFGMMVAFTLFLAIVCELFLLPVLLKWLRPFKI